MTPQDDFVIRSFDTANQILYGADNPTNAYVVMKKWIEQVHIKDCYEPYERRASWAQDIEWGRGDASRTYGMIDFLRANGFAGPMLVEHESGSADPDVREREILTAVRAIRGEPAPTVAPGVPFGPFASRADAEEALECGVVAFESADDVRTVLEGSEILSLAAYKAMFAPVFGGSGSQVSVTFSLTEAGTNALVQSANEVVRNLDLATIAALPSEGSTRLDLSGGRPGFYYTLRGSASLGGLEGLCIYGPGLCGADGKVSFPEVKKPSDAAGFFSISVSETEEKSLESGAWGNRP